MKNGGAQMNINKLNGAVDELKEGLRTSLLATDIWAVEDGMSLASFNPQPEATALFNRITADMNETLENSGFPALGRYYLLDLVDGNKVFIIPMGKYQWGILVDSNAQLGLILNVLLPKVVDKFEEALVED